jgi:hypothetical protein
MQLRWRFGIAIGFFLLLGDLQSTFARVNSYGRLPPSFEPNLGQTDSRVKFLFRGSHHTVFLTPGEAVLKTKLGPVVRMKFVHANPKPEITGTQELPGKVNYFIGNDPKRWLSNLPTYARVHYKEVYPGIDLVYHGDQGQLEYDFLVHPGADPGKIGLELRGADRLEVDADGDLLLHTATSTIRQRRPAIYQEVDGLRRQVRGGYVLKGRRHVGFQVHAYDRARPLVIDPVIYSTYLGGSANDSGNSIAVDSAGAAYVTGFTASLDFPTTAIQTASGGNGDAFVTKLNPAGSAQVYSTYLGGSGLDQGYGIAVDSSGSAYVTGLTGSPDFPTTSGAFQTALGGSGDAFVTKLDPDGTTLVYSTYLGGRDFDSGYGIAVDSSGSAYVTGDTSSSEFPTASAFQSALGGSGDAFVTKLDSMGSTLLFSTYLGGSNLEHGAGIAVDSSGSAYVTGRTFSADFPTTSGAFQTALAGRGNAFVTSLDSTGSTLVYSTYLGGSTEDEGYGIAVDSSGSAYVTGLTVSTNFPTTAGAFQTTPAGGTDAFVTKLNPSGSGLVYSSCLGGNSTDEGFGIAVDLSGSAYVTGLTGSPNFPTTAGASQTTFGGGDFDVFMTRLNPAGSALVHSTYLGGSSTDKGLGIGVDSAGLAYVTGFTSSTDFPTTSGALQTTFGNGGDAFVASIATAAAPAGEVEGAGKIAVPGGVARFGFEVERNTTGDAPSGDFKYRNHARQLTVRATQILAFDMQGNTATFSGNCNKRYDGGDWMPCTFSVNITDNDNPQPSDGHEETAGGVDTFTIQVSGEPLEGGTLIRGNVDIETH